MSMILDAYTWQPAPAIRQVGRPSKLDEHSEVIGILSDIRGFAPRQIADFLRAHGVRISNSAIYYHLDKMARNKLTHA